MDTYNVKQGAHNAFLIKLYSRLWLVLW